ncbi:hypothetical protein GQ457_08G033040 [Hibiscus cannabinus]
MVFGHFSRRSCPRRLPRVKTNETLVVGRGCGNPLAFAGALLFASDPHRFGVFTVVGGFSGRLCHQWRMFGHRVGFCIKPARLVLNRFTQPY